jgi:hypothetical protein
MSKPSTPVVEMAIKKLERYKLPGTDHIPAEMTQAGGRKVCSEVHELIKSTWNKNCPNSGRSWSLYPF